MAYTFTITEVRPVITATVTSSTIAVYVDNSYFSLTEITTVVSATTRLSTVTQYNNAIELKVDDFDNYYKGDWVNGNTYRRGDIVNYAYSLYTSNVATFTNYVSTTPPPEDLGVIGAPDSVGNHSDGKWRRVVWNEAPRAFLTITDTLVVGGNTTIGGTLGVTGAGSFGSDVSITGGLTVGGGAATGGLIINGRAKFNGWTTFTNTVTFLGAVDMSLANLTALNLQVINTSTTQDLVVTRNSTLTNIFNTGTAVFTKKSSDSVYDYPSIIAQDSIWVGTNTGATLNVGSTPQLFGESIFANRTNYFYGQIVNYGIPKPGQDFAGFIYGRNIESFNKLRTGWVEIGRLDDVTSKFTNTNLIRNATQIANTVTFTTPSDTGTPVSLEISSGTFLNVKGQLNVGGVNFPTSLGSYGQVLFNNGAGQSSWEFTGALYNWSLTDTLYTNGYNILSNGASNELKIGIGESNAPTQGNIRFIPAEVGQDEIHIRWDNQVDNTYAKFIANNGDPYITLNVPVYGALVSGVAPLKVGYGIKFPDNSIQTTAASGSGSTGYTGSKGDTGSQGTPGGYTGSRGFAGYNGSNGYNGSKGDAGGYTGSRGDTGYVGSRGIPGNDGARGYTGSQGFGYTGSTGYVGSASNNNNMNLSMIGVTNGYAIANSTSSGVAQGGSVAISSNDVEIRSDAQIATRGRIQVENTNILATVGVSSSSIKLNATTGIEIVSANPLAVSASTSTFTGAARFNDPVNFREDVTMAKTLSVTGNSTLAGTVTLNGSVTIANTFTVTGTNVIINSVNPIKLNASGSTTSTVVIGNDANYSTLNVNRIESRTGQFGPAFPNGIQFGDGSYQVTAFQTGTNLRQVIYDFGPIIGD